MSNEKIKFTIKDIYEPQIVALAMNYGEIIAESYDFNNAEDIESEESKQAAEKEFERLMLEALSAKGYDNIDMARLNYSQQCYFCRYDLEVQGVELPELYDYPERTMELPPLSW